MVVVLSPGYSISISSKTYTLYVSAKVPIFEDGRIIGDATLLQESPLLTPSTSPPSGHTTALNPSSRFVLRMPQLGRAKVLLRSALVTREGPGTQGSLFIRFVCLLSVNYLGWFSSAFLFHI